MKKFKLKLSKNRLKEDKYTIIVIGFVALSLGLIFNIIGNKCPKILDFLWNYILNPISSVLFYLFSDNYLIYYITGFLFGFLAIRVILVRYNKKLKFKDKEILWNKRIRELLYLLIAALLVINCQFVGESTSLLNTYNLKEESTKNYTLEDLYKIRKYVFDNVKEYSGSFERDENGEIIYNGSINDLVIKDLKNLSNEYPFLKGIYPRGYRNSGLHNDGTSAGLTSRLDFSVIIPNNQEITTRKNAITHEYAHVKGVLRENEATFMSIIAGINSDNDLSKYTGYKEALGWLMSAFDQIENETTEETDEINIFKINSCIENNYKEYCLVTDATTYEFIKNFDEVILESYYFKYYDKNKYKNVLDKLNEFDIKYYLQEEDKDDEEEIKYEDIFNKAKDEDYLIIKIDTKKINIDKFYSFLENNIRFFEYFYNEDYDIYKTDEDEDFENYYLKPYSRVPYYNYAGYNKEFNYDRVTRLLLEYFDNKDIL